MSEVYVVSAMSYAIGGFGGSLKDMPPHELGAAVIKAAIEKDVYKRQAMVLAQDTPYIFLDEPTTYLDLNYQLEVLDLLKMLNQKNKKTIVMVLHDLN